MTKTNEEKAAEDAAAKAAEEAAAKEAAAQAEAEKRAAAKKPEWIIPRGIAYLDKDGLEIRFDAGTEVAHGVIPADLVDGYAERGDIIEAGTPEADIAKADAEAVAMANAAAIAAAANEEN